MKISKISVVALVVLLAACGGPYQADRLKPEELANVKKIVILPFNLQPKAEVDIDRTYIGWASSAAAFALAKGADTRKNKFTDALEAMDFDFNDYFVSELQSAVRRVGVPADMMDFRRTKDNILGAVPPGMFEKRYPKVDDAAILDVYVNLIGYSATTLTSDYLPTLHVGARLIDGDTHEVLYENLIHYRDLGMEGSHTVLAADQQYAFENFPALMEDVSTAKDGLQQAIDSVVAELVIELRGRTRS